MEANNVNQNLITSFYEKHEQGVVPEVSSMTIPITLIQKTIYSYSEVYLKEKYDLLHSEVNVLASLHTNNKVLSPTQLYDLTIFSSGGMTKILKKLEARGFITREADKNDKRCMLVRLTDSGDTTIKTVLEDINGECSVFFDVLDDNEKEMFKGLLKKVLLNINNVECSLPRKKS